jgi:D-xylose transport system substrate-binding protein
MRTLSVSTVLLGMVLAAGLYGCSSGGGGPEDERSTGLSELTAACSVNDPTAVPASGPPMVDASEGKGKVGVLLPRNPGRVRPVPPDVHLLTSALRDRGVTAEAATPATPSAFITAAQRMIDHGATVLILDAIDDASGVTVERTARQAGVEVIDYDHLTLGGSARYYVSTDAESIGRLQAKTLTECLSDQGVVDPRIIIIDGGTDVDNGAVLLDKGVHEELDPLVAAGQATIEEEASVTGWRSDQAATVFRVALDAAGGQVDGVLAASDDIADAVIGVLAQNRLDGQVVVAGQGSTAQGLRNIVTGRQSVTMFEDPRDEPEAAAQLAAALVVGRRPSLTGLAVRPFTDPQAPTRPLEAVLLPARVITRADVRDVVDAGALTTAEICAGITDSCSALGLS